MSFPTFFGAKKAEEKVIEEKPSSSFFFAAKPEKKDPAASAASDRLGRYLADKTAKNKATKLAKLKAESEETSADASFSAFLSSKFASVQASFSTKPAPSGAAADDHSADDKDSIELLEVDEAMLAALQNDPNWEGPVKDPNGKILKAKSSKSTAVTLPSSLGGSKYPPTPSRVVYASVCRQKPATKGHVTLAESFTADVPVIAVELGRKLMSWKAAPGWDDIHCDGWRAVKLPVHDMAGATGYVVVFGGEYDPKKAQVGDSMKC